MDHILPRGNIDEDNTVLLEGLMISGIGDLCGWVH
jgi:hypothetical protein